MSKFICDLAWSHLSIMPHGVSSICCVADHSKMSSRAMTENKTLTAGHNTISEIINSDTYKKIRLEMLDGKIPEACMGCHKVEQAGGTSKRIRDGQKHGLNHLQLTNLDGSIEVDLRDVELRLGNYCNLKCRGCNAESSTSWIQDYHKLKNVIQLPSNYDGILKDPSTNYDWCESQEFYEDLLTSSPNMKQLHISGGEPFLVPKHFKILELLIERGQTDIGIHYITNLNYNLDKLIPALEKMREFSYISISFSIDDVGDRNGYIRSLSDWNLTLRNLKRFMTEFPEFYYSITQTINAYNFLYCEELYTFLLENNLYPSHGINFNHIHAPDYMSANILPIELRQQKLLEVEPILPAYMHNNLHGRYWNSPENGKLEYFKKVSDAMDDVRKERGSVLFPKLWELL
jgi:organic radical activating enzyme